MWHFPWLKKAISKCVKQKITKNQILCFPCTRSSLVSGLCFQTGWTGSSSDFPVMHLKKKVHYYFLNLETSLKADHWNGGFLFIHRRARDSFLRKGSSEQLRADAVELALEKTDVGCFDPSDKAAKYSRRDVGRFSKENFSSVAWS